MAGRDERDGPEEANGLRNVDGKVGGKEPENSVLARAGLPPGLELSGRRATVSLLTSHPLGPVWRGWGSRGALPSLHHWSGVHDFLPRLSLQVMLVQN